MKIKDSIVEIRSNISPADQLKIIILSFLVLILFAPTIIELTGVWYNNDDYSHGFFVIPIAFFMLWQKREKLFLVASQSSWIGFPFFVAGAIVYVISFITNFHTLTNISMIILILSLLIFISGWKLTVLLLFPVLFLLFMFPIPSAYYIMMTNPLKLMITTISADIIELFGITVYQDGNLLFFSNTQLEVAEACSGIRSLYSYLMLGCVFALISGKLILKVIMVLSAIPLSLFVNIVRVTVTGILSNYYGPTVAQGFFHEFTGFFLFVIGFIILLLVYYLVERNAIKQKSNSSD